MEKNTTQAPLPVVGDELAHPVPGQSRTVRIIPVPPLEIRDPGRVKMGDGGTAPARQRTHRQN